MNESLRPLNLGEILDRTFQVYRSRFLLFLMLAALPVLAVTALQVANFVWWKLYPAGGPRALLGLGGPGILYSLAVYQVALFFHLLLWPAFSHAASRVYLGEETSLAAALKDTFRRWAGLLGGSLLDWLLLLAVPELVLGGGLIGLVYLLIEVLKLPIFVSDLTGPWIAIFLTAAVWCVAAWWNAALVLAVPVWTLEGFGAGRALRRAWGLSRESRFRLAFARVMPPFIGWVLNLAFSTLILWLLFTLLRRSPLWFAGPRLYAGVSLFTAGAVGTLIAPIFPIALTLLYYDQRVRHEGYDIERMMECAGWTAGENETATPQ
ncbi:MAG: glycerophosphoryl diester phosphodiesterase membrane domain-containing protein [Terracidiphilus sp.]